MKKVTKINRIGVAIFGTLTLAALAGVCCGATHQLVVAVLCGTLAIALATDKAKKTTN